MATRKSKAAPSAKTFVDSDGFVCLSGELFWKWKALEAANRAATIELEDVQKRIALETQKHPELVALMERRGGVMGELSVARSGMTEIVKQFEDGTGLVYAECAINDQSGRVFHVKQDGTIDAAPIPVRNGRVKKKR